MAIRIRHDNGYAAAAAQAAFQAGQAKAQREDQQQQQELRSRAALQAQGAAFDMAREQQRTRSQMLRDAYLGSQDQAKLQAQLADKQAQRDFQAQNYADLREHQANQLLMKGQQEKEFQAFKEQAPQRARELEIQRLDQAAAELMARRGDTLEDEDYSAKMVEINRRKAELDLTHPEPTPEEQQAEMQRDFETSTLPDPTGNGVRWKRNKDGEWEAINPPKKEEDPQIEIQKEKAKAEAEQVKVQREIEKRQEDDFAKFWKDHRLKKATRQVKTKDGTVDEDYDVERTPDEMQAEYKAFQEARDKALGRKPKAEAAGQPPQTAPAAAPSGAPAGGPAATQPQQAPPPKTPSEQKLASIPADDNTVKMIIDMRSQLTKRGVPPEQHAAIIERELRNGLPPDHPVVLALSGE